MGVRARVPLGLHNIKEETAAGPSKSCIGTKRKKTVMAPRKFWGVVNWHRKKRKPRNKKVPETGILKKTKQDGEKRN